MQKQFRIYKHVNAKFQFFGLTVEQMAILVTGLLSFFTFEAFTLKFAAFISTALALSFYKRISKRFAGVSLKSYTEWFLGLRVGLGPFFPPSSKRRIMGD